MRKAAWQGGLRVTETMHTETNTLRRTRNEAAR